VADPSDPNFRRIELAVSCRDADILPRVPDAGTVRDDRVQVMHNGVLVEADGYQGPWMTEIIERLRGVHEPQEELAFSVVLERLARSSSAAPVVMELGSWWAYYSLWALQRIPSARSFCIEPDPAYLETGRRNFALNGRRGEFAQAAVGYGPTPPQPFLCESDGLEHDVPTEGLASLLARFGLSRVDLLLVDVQGAEVPLFDGARALLQSGAVRFMVVSTHHHRISGDPLTHQRCVMLLRELGAHVIAEHTVAESFTGDGLLVVSFDPADRDLSVIVSRCRVSDSLFGDPLWDLADSWNDAASLRARLADATEPAPAMPSRRKWRAGIAKTRD
jgi:FkbM family methyltransferase